MDRGLFLLPVGKEWVDYQSVQGASHAIRKIYRIEEHE